MFSLTATRLPLPLLISLAVLLVGVIGLVVVRSTSQAAVGTLEVYTGSATITRGSRTIAGVDGTKVREGDTITVGSDSRAGVTLPDGSVARFEAGTTVRLAQFDVKGNTIETVRWELADGRVWSAVQSLPETARWEVETPTIVAAVQGTAYNTDVREAASWVYVSRHQVGVRLQSGRDAKRVNERELFTIRDAHQVEDFAAGPRPASDDFFDDWVRFNEAEDAALFGDETSATIEGEAETGEASVEEPPTQEQPSETTPTTTAPAPSTSRSPKPKSPTSSTEPTTIQAQPGATSPPSTTPPTVTPPPPPTPTPTPSPPTLTSLELVAGAGTLEVGQSTVLTVTAALSDGSRSTVTSDTTFTVSPSGHGHVSGTTFVADAAGTVSVSASYGGLTSTVSLIVTEPTPPPQPELLGLRLSCSSDLEKRTAQCSATALYSDETTKDVTTAASWSLKDPASGRITNAGFYTAGQEGGDTIIATYGGKSGSVSLNL